MDTPEIKAPSVTKRVGCLVHVPGDFIVPLYPEAAEHLPAGFQEKGIWVQMYRLSYGEQRDIAAKCESPAVQPLDLAVACLYAVHIGLGVDEQGKQIAPPKCGTAPTWNVIPKLEKASFMNALDGAPFELLMACWAAYFSTDKEKMAKAMSSFRVTV